MSEGYFDDAPFEPNWEEEFPGVPETKEEDPRVSLVEAFDEEIKLLHEAADHEKLLDTEKRTMRLLAWSLARIKNRWLNTATYEWDEEKLSFVKWNGKKDE